MHKVIAAAFVAGATLVPTLGVTAPAGAAIVTTQASLVNGQLTIVGSGAVPNSTVTVDDGPPFGQANAQGDFSISASGFSEPSCVATLYDGSVSVQVTLAGCTPTISPPPSVPGPPSLVGPSTGASVTEPVALSWQPPGGAKKLDFQWQVSTDPRFGTLVLSATTGSKATSTTFSGLALGTYYWRVQSVKFPPEPYFPLFGNWSPVGSFTITGLAPGSPGRPMLTSPEGTEFHPEETFPLTWSSVAGAASYRLQISSDELFAPGTLLVDVPESGTVAHAPLIRAEEPLFIRVFGVAPDGTLGLPSRTLSIQLSFHARVPAPPRLRAPADRATVTLPVTVAWTPDPNPQTEGYQLEIDSTPRLARNCTSAEECVTGITPPRYTLFSLPAGPQYWRVRSFHGLAGPGVGAVTGWSPARKFTVSNAPPRVQSLTIDVYTGGGVVLRSHTRVFSGTNEDNEAFGTVQLTTPASAGGQTVTLTSTNPKVAAVPASVMVPAGQAQAGFLIQPNQVAQPTTLTLSAVIGQQSATAPLTVDPSRLNQVFIESNQKVDGRSLPNIFSGGTDAVGTLLFDGNAPAGTVVTMASSSPTASVPGSVNAAGQLASFEIRTRPVTTSTPVVLTATWRGRTVSAKMTLQPPPTLLTPAAGASFAAGHVVIFRWHTPVGLSSQLQVAANSEFTNPILDFDTNTAQAWAVLSPLPSGTLYWRVLGVDIYGNEGPPPTARPFTIR
jgi:hypothetical protein